MSLRIYRVIVRGHFHDLSAETKAALLAEVEDHEIYKATYTEHGSFTYEPNLVAFNFRYELRTEDDDADPVAIGMAKAAATLAEWGIDHRHLRGTSNDMTAMWSD